MKKMLALLLVISMVLALAACGSNEEPAATTEATTAATTEATTTATTEATTEATTTATTPADTTTADTTVTVDNPAIYFSMTIGDMESNAYVSLTASEMEGEITVEYVGDVKKVGKFDATVMHAITAALNETALADLNGQSEYGEGTSYASMFIQFADDSMLSADYTGIVPDAFTAGYEAMDAVFAELTANLEVYVPQPMVMGEVNANALAEMNAVLFASTLPNLDSFAITDIALDEFFGYTAGLSSADGILNGTACSPMMMATAYSLVIVEVENADNLAAVCADFAANMDWAKWICVSASDAMIATKGNLALCLMASSDGYLATADGVTANGWEVVEVLSNPNMG